MKIIFDSYESLYHYGSLEIPFPLSQTIFIKMHTNSIDTIAISVYFAPIVFHVFTIYSFGISSRIFFAVQHSLCPFRLSFDIVFAGNKGYWVKNKQERKIFLFFYIFAKYLHQLLCIIFLTSIRHQLSKRRFFR